MLFTVLITFILAALSGIGVGGGGLFVIYLSIFTDTPQLTAQGMNLLFFLLSSGASVTVHLRNRTICASAVLVMALFGIVGALVGTSLSARVPQHLLRQIFGGMLIVSGMLSLMKKEEASKEPNGK
ncbi:MAG: sulfite exporter TauE/SafE family protein [Clostridia bacterium]|nr:sulfite exporter TauE/SafE family protein [Clostridia bacterium]